MIVPASVLGREGAVAPNDRITIGLVGCGGQGRRNAQRLTDAGGQITAVCDVDAERLASTADQFEDATPFADHRELIAEAGCDAVIVATPDHWHSPVSVRAARAGKHVYVEKPLANTIGGSRAIVDAVQEHGVVCQVGSHERSGDSVRRAAELVRGGQLGKIKRLEINLPTDQKHHLDVKLTRDLKLADAPQPLDFDAWCGPTQPMPYSPQRCHFAWRFVLAYGGGEMTDRGAHVIDVGHLGLGIDDAEAPAAGPMRVKATGVRNPTGPYDTFNDFRFEADYPGGVRMVGQSAGERGVKFIGTDGWLFVKIHGGALSASHPSILEGEPSGTLGRVASHHASFLDAIRTGEQPTAPVLAGHRTAVVCHVLNIAMQLGRELQWDSAAERFVDDDEANKLIAAPSRQPYAV